MKKLAQMLFVWLAVLISISFSYATSVDDLAKTVFYLRGKKTGTAFLTEHSKKWYLVTAAHVAREMSDESEVFWNTTDGKLKTFTFKQLHEGVPNSRWFFHQKADIAVHPFGFPGKAAHLGVQEELFVSKDETIPLLTKVVVVGFPFSLGVGNVLSPIAKRTEIASWRTTISLPNLSQSLPDEEFILLDDALAGGYSGAHVFFAIEEPRVVKGLLQYGGPPKLIGIVSRALSDKTGGKITLVVPISYLWDIYDSNEFKEYEKLSR